MALWSSTEATGWVIARTALRRFLDEEQAALFLAESRRSKVSYFRLYLFAVRTGLRLGELLGLRWQDVNLLLEQLTVRQTMYRMGGAKKRGLAPVLFKEPKTHNAVRTLKLSAGLVAELRALSKSRRSTAVRLGLTTLGSISCSAR